MSHGCTGKGNDQVRFELAFYSLCPQIKVLAPWRLPEFYTRFQGRSDLLTYAEEKKIPVVQTKSKPWSTDENMFHISYEAGILEDPNTKPPADMWKLTKSLQNASSAGVEHVTVEFKVGEFVSIKSTSSGKQASGVLAVFEMANSLGREHGIGRIDIVENRFVGIKSRGCYETPGGTILHRAHLDLEGLTMDREVRRIRDEMSRRLADVIYNGMWFSPERSLITHTITETQKTVTGTVTLELYKGNVTIVGRESKFALYDSEMSSMDVEGGFTPADSTGFIRTHAIRLKASAERDKLFLK